MYNIACITVVCITKNMHLITEKSDIESHLSGKEKKVHNKDKITLIVSLKIIIEMLSVLEIMFRADRRALCPV